MFKLEKPDYRIYFVACSLLLCLSPFQPLVVISSEESRIERYNFNLNNLRFSINYEDHDQISINGNVDLLNQSNNENWQGNGSELFPIIITGLNITSDSGSLLSIRNTDLYVDITKCLMEGGFNAIDFANVTNGYISQNIIKNCGNAGIYFSSTYSCVIDENEIFSPSWVGIWLENSPNNEIRDNLVLDTGSDGISLHTQSRNCRIVGNNVTRSGHYGLYVSDSINCLIAKNFALETSYAAIETSVSPNSTINNNLVIRNMEAHSLAVSASPYSEISNNHVFGAGTQGITVRYSPHSIINKNWVQDDYYGVFLNFSENSTITNNVFESNEYGMWIHHKSENSSIVHNKISQSTIRGIEFYQTDHCIVKYNLIVNSVIDIYLSESSNNTITLNDFIDNGHGSDSGNTGLSNNISANHWSTWITPDSDNNGFVDTPYSLGSNSDNFPYVNRIHYLQPFSIINPKGGENINGTISVNWELSSDSLGFSVAYSIYYSSDLLNWLILETDLVNNVFQWDTTSVPDSSYYLQITASSESIKGLEFSAITLDKFHVNNTESSSTTTATTESKAISSRFLWFFGLLVIFSIYRRRIKK